MLSDIQRIKAVASELRDTTSQNDPQRDKLQFIVDECNELIIHYVDDGR